MTPETRTKVYRTPAEYVADKADALAHGWEVGAADEQPDGTLKVWYRNTGRRPVGTATKVAMGIAAAVTILLVLGAMADQRGGLLGSTPVPRPVTFSTLADRDWALLIKDPDAHQGEGVSVWACIVQFDTATGAGAFRGNALNHEADSWLLDGENAVFQGDEGILAPFVKDDVVSVKAVVQGTIDYDTVMGGTNTAPLFEVRSIERTGSCGL